MHNINVVLRLCALFRPTPLRSIRSVGVKLLGREGIANANDPQAAGMHVKPLAKSP
jgi:hypothetical protein